MDYHRTFELALERLSAAVEKAEYHPTLWAKAALQREIGRTTDVMRLLEKWVLAELQEIAPKLVHDGIVDLDYLDTAEFYILETESAIDLAYLWLNIREAIVQYLPEHGYLITSIYDPERIAQKHRALARTLERVETATPRPTPLKLTPTTKPNAPNAAA